MTFLRRIFWDEKFSRLQAGWSLLTKDVVFIAFVAALGLLAKSLDGHVPRDPLDNDVSVAFSLAIGLSIFLSVWFAGHFIDRRCFVDFGFQFS